ncbi:MAG: flagellar protein [Lachnospiraceae bacterium]|nr:flagellar protein [Lachnospiraceae bacterium]
MNALELQTRISSIEQAADKYLQNNVKNQRPASDISFEDVLKSKVAPKESLKFSKHAYNRLSDRNLSLSEDQERRLNEGVSKAKEKGINDSLVLLDSLAFIVNVPNNTVITALDSNEAATNVFTNIDGAVIA